MENSEHHPPTAREMVDAFVHPPTRLPIDKRFDEDRVVVLSHVELWSWRVVVRALAANPDFDSQPTQPLGGHPDGPASVGIVTAEVIVDDQRHADWRRGIDWMNSWSLTDDVGAEYVCTGWGGSPSDVQLWCDLAWTYDGVVSSDERRLIISGPVVGAVEVAVPE